MRTPGDTLKWTRVAAWIACLIETGKLGAGDAVPLRDYLAGAAGVSPHTVTRAFRQLQRRHVIVRAGRGYFLRMDCGDPAAVIRAVIERAVAAR